MITSQCIEAYEAANLGGQMFFLAPGHVPALEFEEREGFLPQTCVCDPDETEEAFLDRIERSKKAGRNLFRYEWKPYRPESDVLL